MNLHVNVKIGSEECDIKLREWGSEELLVLAPGKYMLRRLRMTAGTSGGLQKHHFKDEASLLLKGKLLVAYVNSSGDLVNTLVSEGDYFHFPTGSIHKVSCIEDAEIIEVSTPHLNDRVRMDDLYGLDPSCCSLPTTEVSDVRYL
jgi:mannose-6-phosphate isomerase